MFNDGSYALSVGTDKFIHIWDIRAKNAVHSVDGTSYTEMNDIGISSPPLDGLNHKATSSTSLNGLATVAHKDGSLTFWDMNMRKCLV